MLGEVELDRATVSTIGHFQAVSVVVSEASRPKVIAPHRRSWGAHSRFSVMLFIRSSRSALRVPRTRGAMPPGALPPAAAFPRATKHLSLKPYPKLPQLGPRRPAQRYHAMYPK